MAWGPIYGALADKKGVGIATLVCMMPSAIILVLSPLLKGFAGAAILAVLIAPATVVGMIGTLAFISVFGTRESGTLVGLSHAATSIGGIIGPPLAGFSYDSTGSYITFLVIGGILMLCGTLLTYLSTSSKAIRAVRNKEESVNTIS
jgi:MFS family permease